MYVEMKNIYKKYGDFLASDNVSFGVEKGKLVALLGPSGSGKTTLLRMIAGLETPNSGDIYIDGKRVNDIPASKRGIGFVFQNYQLIPTYNILQNIVMPLIVRGMTEKQAQEACMPVIEMLGLSHRLRHKPSELSGGQKQRVSIARALVGKPALLLADEPTGALDTSSGKDVLTLFEKLHEMGNTIVMITHDLNVANYAERIVHIVDGCLS